MTPDPAARLPASVVVPTRDRVAMLERCLDHLLAAVRPDDEVIVVDSASADPGVAGAGRARRATVLRCEQPGVDLARNAGWRSAAHDLILFVDDDVAVDPGWVDAMVRAFTRHPEAAFVTGRILVPPDQAGAERPVAVKDDPEPGRLDAATTGVLGHSASLGVRRAALERVGGFDEALGAGARFRSAPEVDLFDRLFAAGLSGWYEPEALAWHDQWRGRRQLVGLDWRYGVGSGARLAKLLRTDRARARQVAGEVLWTNGIGAAARHLKDGYQFGALASTAHAAGALVGLVQAIGVPVAQGHFRPRPRHPRTMRRS